MDAKNTFVYKNIVPKNLFIQGKFQESHSFTALRMQHVCSTSLQKWELNNLSAPVWRWYQNDRMGAFIVVNKITIQLEPDRIFLIPPYTHFSSGTRNPFRQLYMHFFLDSPKVPLPGNVFSHVATREEKQVIHRLSAALGKQKETPQMEISFLAQILVNQALREIPANYWSAQSPDRRIETAIHAITGAGLQQIGNQELARRVGMNVNAFTRGFKEATGHTPHQYLLRLRMEKACQLLQHSHKSLEAIAEQTGFCDRFHFTRTFSRQFHTGPAAFRRRASMSP